MKAREFKKPGHLVEIHWIDSCSTQGWLGDDQPDGKPLECRSVGYLVKRSKTGVVVCQNVSEQGATGQWMTIPASCIRRVRRLK